MSNDPNRRGELLEKLHFGNAPLTPKEEQELEVLKEETSRDLHAEFFAEHAYLRHLLGISEPPQ